jgi:hypothetical protein
MLTRIPTTAASEYEQSFSKVLLLVFLADRFLILYTSKLFIARALKAGKQDLSWFLATPTRRQSLKSIWGRDAILLGQSMLVEALGIFRPSKTGTGNDGLDKPLCMSSIPEPFFDLVAIVTGYLSAAKLGDERFTALNPSLSMDSPASASPMMFGMGSGLGENSATHRLLMQLKEVFEKTEFERDHAAKRFENLLDIVLGIWSAEDVPDGWAVGQRRRTQLAPESVKDCFEMEPNVELRNAMREGEQTGPSVESRDITAAIRGDLVDDWATLTASDGWMSSDFWAGFLGAGLC